MNRYAHQALRRTVAFPLAVTTSGRAATVPVEQHVEQLVDQLLLTDPGERVNRPELGCGLVELVFDALSDELVAATEFIVRGRLQEWLGDLIVVEDVRCESSAGILRVAVSYVLLATRQRRTRVVQR